MRCGASGKLRVLAALATIAFLGASAPAGAASFDCGKAAAPDEIAICANPALSDLDVKMATLYGVRMQIPMLMGSKGAAKDEQTSWLQQRSSCGGNVQCLKKSYQARIRGLNDIITAAMQDYCVKLGICG